MNALIHRDYLIEVHIDIYDDRLEIYSPGGMFDGINVQDRDIMTVPSRRRNPIIADMFSRLNLMERRGSGFKKIIEDYQNQYRYADEMRASFVSEHGAFFLTLQNLNFGAEDTASDSEQDGAKDRAHDRAHDKAHDKQDTIEMILAFCASPKSRQEIMEHLGFISTRMFSKNYLQPLLASGRLVMTIPDKPKSKNQKYVKK